MLIAPEASFARELTRMNLVPSHFQAVLAKGTHAEASSQAELDDLRAALKRANIPDGESETICKSHAAGRQVLQKYVFEKEQWESSRPWVYEQDGRAHRGEPQGPPPPFPKIEISPGLPLEFSDYLQGALAWHNPALRDRNFARRTWEQLLEHPKADRHFKSTWAAFMLGRSWEQENPGKALTYFRQVRQLAGQGFADSLGLAAASLGLEARIYLHQTNYPQAIKLYLEQFATGDETAITSLRFVAAEIFGGSPARLQELAKNPVTQRLLTAYVISERLYDDSYYTPANRTVEAHARNWLAAVEAADVQDVDSAEKLALAAYRVNEMALAQRWIKRAPNSPVAQWLQAKLLFRAGKVDQAAALLARVARYFPVEPRTNGTPPVELKDSLFVDKNWGETCCVPAERQVLGELGVVRLARREYAQALDALLNAGFWMDAAYVAERVLTLDELKGYVDAYWPPVSAGQIAEEKKEFGNNSVSPAILREQIRYLLARRMNRAFRGEEARDYYPVEWLSQYDRLMQDLRLGWDESQPSEQRARALFEAAIITRTNGLELIGTEVEPDWRIHAGDFEEGVSITTRSEYTNALLAASADELHRASQHNADPELRFHYRYQAASLAWEAAKLMPNNSDETARVLCTGGSWLKNRDPDTADLFYKALVRRNRKTTLGAEADRIRWFPVLDAEGHFVPRPPKPEPPVEQLPGQVLQVAQIPENAEPAMSTPDTDPQPRDLTPPDSVDTPENAIATTPPAIETPGIEYIVHAGDSIAGIIRALYNAGIPITVRDLLRANPELEISRLRVGQKILIPLPKE